MDRPLHVSDVVDPIPPTSRMLVRAMRLRCPRCDTGHLFHRWFILAERCPNCGYRFERTEGLFLGAYLLNLVVTLASLFGVLIWMMFREAADASATLVPPLVVGGLCAVVLPIVFFPFSYTLWIAFDLSSDPLELREIAEALDATNDATTNVEATDHPNGESGPAQ